MKYRIFNLAVEFLPKHPQRTSQRTSSLAFGYTSEESLENAKTLLEKNAFDVHKVKLLKIYWHTEFQTLDDAAEPNSKKWLSAPNTHQKGHIEPYTTG